MKGKDKGIVVQLVVVIIKVQIYGEKHLGEVVTVGLQGGPDTVMDEGVDFYEAISIDRRSTFREHCVQQMYEREESKDCKEV